MFDNYSGLQILMKRFSLDEGELLRRLDKNHDKLAQFVRNKTSNDVLTGNTLNSYLSMWMKSFRQNLDIIDQSKDVKHLDLVGKRVLIIGAGPSFYENLDLIKHFQADDDYKILCADRCLKTLLDNDIIPYAVCSLDGQQIVSDYYDYEIVREYSHRVKGVFASTVHPSVIDIYNGEKYFFHAFLEPLEEQLSVSRVMQDMSKLTVLCTGGNVGTAQLFLAAMHKVEFACLLGIDLAYKSDRDLLSIKLTDSLDTSTLSRRELMQFFRREINPFGNSVMTDYVKDAYRDVNESWAPQLGIDVYQCSEYTVFHPDSFKLMRFKEFLIEVLGVDLN